MSAKSEAVAGRWIPWIFVGLFFLVLVANGTMIAIAVSTFTGLETTNAYKRGLAYNEELAAKAEQDRLGWEAALDVTAQDKGRLLLALMLDDRLDNPITSARIRGKLFRPLQAGHEIDIIFDEERAGRYLAEVDLPLAGQWDLRVETEARGENYRIAKRIRVMP